MNLYFFAPWIILAFMIAVVVTTLMIVHFLITLCFVDDGDDYKKSSSSSADHQHHHHHHHNLQQQINSYPEAIDVNPMGKPYQHQQLPEVDALRKKSVTKTGGHLKLPLVPWIKWGRRSKRGSDRKDSDEMKSYIRSSSFCDISVTSSSYHPYPSSWVISSPEMYQRSAYHPDEMDSNPNEEGNLINIPNGGKLKNHHTSYDSLATTDTEFYRDWNHSIEFSEFNDLYYNNNIDPKYKDTNQNVIYI